MTEVTTAFPPTGKGSRANGVIPKIAIRNVFPGTLWTLDDGLHSPPFTTSKLEIETGKML
jgi:hypothetical protein